MAATKEPRRRRAAVAPSSKTIVKARANGRPAEPRRKTSSLFSRLDLPKSKNSSLHDCDPGGLVWTSAPPALPSTFRVAAQPQAAVGWPVSESYAPESPWGVLGIAYDPASPPWIWSNVTVPAKPQSATVCAPTDGVHLTALPMHSSAYQLQVQCQPQPTGPPIGTHLLEILDSVLAASANSASILSKIDWPSKPSAAANDAGTYVTDKRFVLMGDHGERETESAKVKGKNSPKTKRAKAPIDSKIAATLNGLSNPETPQRVVDTNSPDPSQTPVHVPAVRSPTPRCCPTEVPESLHIILDKANLRPDATLIERYSVVSHKLCPRHFEKYKSLKAAVNPRQSLTPGAQGTPDAAVPTTSALRQNVMHSPPSSHVPPDAQPLQISHVGQIAQLPQPQISPQSQQLTQLPHKLQLARFLPPALSPQPPQIPQSPQPEHHNPHPLAPALFPQHFQPTLPPIKKRRASTSRQATKKPKTVSRGGVRPEAKLKRDGEYRERILAEIQAKAIKMRDSTEESHGSITNGIIRNLLSVAQPPNASPKKGPVDIHFLTGDEARAMLDAGSPNEPVVTEKEQMFEWQPSLRPIAELFRRMENLDRRVSVQVPSRSCMDDSFESRELVEVRDRFLAPERKRAATAVDDSQDPRPESNGNGVAVDNTNANAAPAITNDEEEDEGDPWNILDLRSPLPAAVLPQFLTSENCQLLLRLRDEVLNPSRAERGTATREQWNEWRDVLEWVLLSQGGHNTSPHTDSHGLATWITVQEGLFGFGWMSRPTPEERDAWMADPHGFTGGRWCYLVLEPGQTVFFNSGTVHFVFRLRTEATLALGGHVLQWTGIARWLEIVAAQMRNPHITNEDMEWSAPKYVRVVAKLVELRLRNGRVEELGGEAAVRQLLTTLKEFDETYCKSHHGNSQKRKYKRKKHR